MLLFYLMESNLGIMRFCVHSNTGWYNSLSLALDVSNKRFDILLYPRMHYKNFMVKHLDWSRPSFILLKVVLT